ncbi:enoyl-CoA hydratase [Nitzschia inconspicua]|uniref:Enoyl-CoA hydratase n=1 Tax=Nitzschia inconspicua TaxID=303405 RepID=A0A9K3PQA1_9STRA|nr:enoyl-CoA hydratase [Nitzschia inconspicua]
MKSSLSSVYAIRNVTIRVGLGRVIPRPYDDRCRAMSSSSASTSHQDQSPLLQKLDSTGILTLTLNRPNQRNALNRDLLQRLNTTLKDAAKSVESTSPVRVIILQSHGYVFSSGHDLKELSEFSNLEDRTAVEQLFDLCSDTMQLFQTIPQPTICAVEGFAAGAGCQLVASCDLVVASSLASFQTPGVTLGLFCHTPAVPLVRSIGKKLAMDMLLTGRTISASEALNHGLVSRMAKNAQKEAAKIAMTIATERSSAVLGMGKEIFHQQAAESDLNDAYKVASPAMAKNMDLYDAKHGIECFLGKRNPQFQDK